MDARKKGFASHLESRLSCSGVRTLDAAQTEKRVASVSKTLKKLNADRSLKITRKIAKVG
jgi:hypothetical protein